MSAIGIGRGGEMNGNENSGIGQLNDRELLVKIYERVNNIKEDVKENKRNIEDHKADHKWLLGIALSVPTAIAAFFKWIL